MSKPGKIKSEQVLVLRESWDDTVKWILPSGHENLMLHVYEDPFDTEIRYAGPNIRKEKENES